MGGNWKGVLYCHYVPHTLENFKNKSIKNSSELLGWRFKI